MHTKFKYLARMHRRLRAACPDGYSVQAAREGRRLYTIISCDDRGYYAPWSVGEIVRDFGFSTKFA